MTLETYFLRGWVLGGGGGGVGGFGIDLSIPGVNLMLERWGYPCLVVTYLVVVLLCLLYTLGGT